MLEKIFKLKENGTNAKTEILAGITTFMTMAYIIALNPNLLTNFAVGTPLWNAVFLATCIGAGLGTITMAFLANKPFAMAPGMGLNTFFAIVVAQIVTITGVSYEAGFQAGLCVMLIEGIVFLVLSVVNVREKIVNSIPLGIRYGISPAIGLMLLNIGFGSNCGIYSETGGPWYVMQHFFGSLNTTAAQTTSGSGYAALVLTTITIFVGLFAIIGLSQKKVKGSVLYGMLIASVVYWTGSFVVLKTNPFASLGTASWVPAFGDMAALTLFKFDFNTLMKLGWFTVITLVFTFCFMDLFDTVGSLIGAGAQAGMLDKDGNMDKMKEALTADAVGTIVGACTGTSTVTTFIESASGIEEGGRTGLTALVTGLIFLACMFIAPLAAIIPPAATSSALIYVGILMLGGLRKIDFDDIAVTVSVFIMVLAMPISGSIGHGIGLGLISYTIVKFITGKAKDVSLLTLIISILFIIKFFFTF